jgi:hypothetical protein
MAGSSGKPVVQKLGIKPGFCIFTAGAPRAYEDILPGIKINTSPTDHIPVDQMQLMRFNGQNWERFGELQTGN